MKIFALTGAPGSGKSAALEIFSHLGWNVIDADTVCAGLHNTPGGTFHETLAGRWGEEVISSNGTTVRAEVAKKVFAAPAEREWLESLMYPEVKRLIKEKIDSMPDNAKVMVEVPLLFEKGWESMFEKTVAVWASDSVRLKRLAERGWTQDEITRRCSAQLTQDQKLARASFGILNDSTLSDLEKQCRELDSSI